MAVHVDIYVWSAFQIFIFFKLASNVVLQKRARNLTGIVGYREDQNGSRRLALPNPASGSDEKLVRATNLFRNDLENILPFSFLALAAGFVQVDVRIYVVLLCVFALARVSHAFSLIGGRQPFRSLFYSIGQACALVLVVLIILRLILIFQTY